MAVLLNEYLPFDSGPGAGVQESGWRNMMKHMLGSASGVIRGFGNDFQTIGDSSGMQVKVNTGECWMRGHYGSSTSQKTLAISSNSSGNPRKDRVVLRCDFVGNEIELDVLTGTPAASPVAPAVTQNTSMWETSLAVVDVANGAVTITPGNVTDARTYTTVVAKYSRSTAQTIPNNTFTELGFNTAVLTAGDVTANSSSTPSQWTLNRAGLWVLTAYLGWSSAGTTGNRSLQIRDSGSTVFGEVVVPAATGGTSTHLNVSTTEYFASGQAVRCVGYHSQGSNLDTVAGRVMFTMMWVGP